MWQYECSNELYHHGILGQKWGIRRYQNKDGSLTDRGKKKANKAYDKEAAKLSTDLAKTSNDRWLRAYNKAANDMNNGLLDKYDSDYKKKLGNKAKSKDCDTDEKYMSGVEKLFDKAFSKRMDAEIYTEMISNKHYKNAMKLVDKYSMGSFNDLVKQNNKVVSDLKKSIE